MDFFEHQEQARRKTGRLIVYFVAAVISIILAVYLVFAAVLLKAGGESSPDTLWNPQLFAAVTLGTIVLIAVGSLYKTAQLARGGEVVARQLSGRPVLSNTLDLRERVLLNVVEEMAIASGTPVPPVYLMDHESGINAFAAGTTPQNAVIGVTRGAIETLKRDELQGVIAHEFSHILNGDMRLNLRLIGLLNGILLIATIGYILMRSSSYSSSSSSSDSDEKKGGNPLPLIGLGLYAIGYIGVFFGHLIKSTVSRQREFLADASAVQFTRFPSGIAGALKKIGGLVAGSQLQTPHAEEASHMFFGNGLSASFLQLLSTHPPLVERVQRIEPSFNGQFPPTNLVDYSQRDLLEPTTLAQRLGVEANVHSQAVAGAQAFAVQPTTATAHIGDPQPEHFEYAASMLDSLPAALAGDARDPLGAVAIIYALLLDDDEPDVREAQIEYLSHQADPRAYQETLRIAEQVSHLPAEAKLPAVSLTLPALHELSPRQLQGFRDDVTHLVQADQQLTLFEFGIHRLILKRLIPRLERRQSADSQVRPGQLLQSVNQLLSTLAYAGTRDDEQASRAFTAGTRKLAEIGSRMTLLNREACRFRALDDALDQLAATKMAEKKIILEGCAECISADDRVTVEEGELLRIISDAFDCPMPPIVP